MDGWLYVISARCIQYSLFTDFVASLYQLFASVYNQPLIIMCVSYFLGKLKLYIICTTRVLLHPPVYAVQIMGT